MHSFIIFFPYFTIISSLNEHHQCVYYTPIQYYHSMSPVTFNEKRITFNGTHVIQMLWKKKE